MGTLKETLTRMTAITIYEEDTEPCHADGPNDITSLTELSCRSCMTYMRDSRLLPCNHIMCMTCLKKQTEASKGTQGSFICPAKDCGKFVLVPAAGLESLPTGGDTGSLSAILAEWSESLPVVLPPEGQVCGVCGGETSKGKRRKKKKGDVKPEVGHECETCDCFLCWECWEGHVAPESETHAHCVRHRHQHDVCCRHGNEIEHYCHDCHATICYMCDVKQHSHHRKERLDTLTQSRTRRSHDLLTHIRDSRDAHIDLSQQAKQLSKEVAASFEEASSKVKAAAEEARRSIDSWEKEQLTLLAIQKSQNTRLVTKVECYNESRGTYLDSVFSSCTKLIDTRHRLKMSLLCSMNETLTTMITTGIGPHQREVTKETVGVPKVNFHKAHLPISYGYVQFGHGLALEKTSVTPSWTWQADTVCMHSPVRQPGDVTFLQNGDMIVSGQLNRNVWSFSPGQKEPQLLCTDLYPLCVDATLDGALAVADGDVRRSVRYFDVRHRTQTDTWWPKEAKNPCSTVHLSDGSRVVLCSLNREGYIYEKGGEFKNKFGTGLFVDALYMCVDSQDRLIVADQEEHCVFVFDGNGEFLMDMGSYGEGEGELNTPKGVCVDCYDNVIVADEGNDRVTVFDEQGMWCRHLVSNDEIIRAPFGVGYTAGNPSKMAVVWGMPGKALTVSVLDIALFKATNT